MKFPLVGGAYKTRSVIASGQRCINYYPEKNRGDATTPWTYYQRPGLVPKVKIGTGPIRCLYRPSTGAGGYAVSGSEVYRIDDNWNTTLIGNITLLRNNICSMIDNGIQILLVDGSSNGWIIPLDPTLFTLASFTIANAGSKFKVGDTIVFAGGTGALATATVSSIGGGGSVTGLTVPVPNGLYSVAPTNPIFMSSTSGDGQNLEIIGTFALAQFQQLVDPTGFFQGADKVDILDTFILWNTPSTINFNSTLSNQILPVDNTYFAGKASYPDPLISLIVNRKELLLMGDLKSEVWYDAGNPLFPFAQLPGAYIEHGLAAKYSLAAEDISVFWLAKNLQGEGMVLRFRGYTTTNISNYALGEAIRGMIKTVGISDAIGYTYQQDNHVFYVLTFPSGNQTWVYDDSIGEPELAWHQEAWTDPKDGSLNRHRGNCAAFINGINVVGDWQDGTIYEMDLDTYLDTVHGAAGPISFIRTFPNVGAAEAPNGQMVEYDGRRMVVNSFVADFEGGEGFADNQISLRWSIDRGKTFGDYVLQDAGAQGEFDIQPVWRNLGIARYPVFELSHSINGPAALNGAWIDAKISME